MLTLLALQFDPIPLILLGNENISRRRSSGLSYEGAIVFLSY